ncbi:unnamed protein product, partial [marine sediment metagenome]
ELEATAVLGRGKEHSKWSPCLAYYKYKPIVEISNKYDNAEAEACAKAFPKVFTIKNNKLIVNKDNLLKYDLAGVCADICKKGTIKIVEDDSNIIFYVESWGQLKPKKVVQASIDVLKEKFDEFTADIKKL